MKRFEDKFALITGASSGMGVDYARILAEQGCHLVLVARRKDRLESLKEKLLSQYDIQIIVIPMDLSETSAPEQLFTMIQERGITIDILINNAGRGLYGPFTGLDWQDQKEMLQLDIVALTHLTKLFGDDMARRGGGYILLVSSMGGYQPLPMYASYAAAKAYVLNFGEALSYEFREKNIHLTVLSPGVTATEFFDGAGQEVSWMQRLLMMQSRRVAEIGLHALAKGKQSVIPGIMNKLIYGTMRFIPRRWLPALAHMAIK